MVTDVEDARRRAAAVPDPELPVVTLGDLGVIRDVRERDGGLEVVITPTYSGCPAMDAIRADIERAVPGATVTTVLAPAWSTDWITDEGREKLRVHGISPPRRLQRAPGEGPVALELTARCPRCGSTRARLVSRYGSTSCKALFTCQDCLEPFDHFKEI
ncbi:phenylacetate-CoA oxygenase subunit PaaJ [Nonomuraea sp. NBC_01738]|uniref:1,2-phenylacetyl-CoA epoxidase subunit PaaD n=1 Tax=Nonomuraea sp. NBC_01738 TaxID=2976003 RepID=UPI002E10F97D|nr:phenylacetate-CoA oxygenase subunit PaaJ [Nonomuraea sp. NBC_01738]